MASFSTFHSYQGNMINLHYIQVRVNTLGHGINIRNKYQLFHLWSVKKLLEKLFSVNDFLISNYGNLALKTKLALEFALKERYSSKKPHCMVTCNALNI